MNQASFFSVIIYTLNQVFSTFARISETGDTLSVSGFIYRRKHKTEKPVFKSDPSKKYEVTHEHII
jgi:hypothetical protein